MVRRHLASSLTAATASCPPPRSLHAPPAVALARTGIAYPVVWELRVDSRRFLLQPSSTIRSSTAALHRRPSTGGAVRVLEDNREVGRGYLK